MPASPTRTYPTRATPVLAGRSACGDSGHSEAAGVTWPVTRIGYRVPRVEFDGIVHAVFARACYFECGDTLLTLGATTLADGPTMMLLGREAAVDLRRAFRRGDTVRCRDGRVHSGGTTLDLRRAYTWRVPDRRPALGADDMTLRIELARTRLAQVRCTRSSVLDRSAEVAIGKLGGACRDLDLAEALDHAQRLVGWGEGLTPAGDDFLVGLCAALAALVYGDAGRRTFVDGFGAILAKQGSRTTPIAAHCLTLAAHGHFNADVLNAIDALRAESDARSAQCMLDKFMTVGATSGADALTGMLCGFAAWSSPFIMKGPERG